MRHPGKFLLALGLAALLTGSTGVLLTGSPVLPVWASEAIKEVAVDVGPHPTPAAFGGTPSPLLTEGQERGGG
jgi:hypothetical protein